MKLPLTGGCQCRAVRYEVRAEPLSCYVCHCTECQKQSGSAFAMSLIVPRDALVYVGEKPQRWTRTADSGRVLDGDFCAMCGTRLVHHPRANAKVSVLKPGTLDDTSWLVPVGHIWTKSAQPWVRIPPDTIQHAGHPDELAPLMQAWRNHRARI